MNKPAASTKWTPQQQAAISRTGSSLLVSAAAGSGKTSVLAERCAYLICDAKEPCNVDQLLVVTFTEAAALEMNKRIRAALEDRPRNTHIDYQLQIIERAQISTLHGF